MPIVPEAETAFVTFTLEPGENPSAPHTLWVDAVQLEEGEQATEYVTALPVEVGFETGRDGNVYHCGGRAEIQVLAYNATDAKRALNLGLSADGFSGEVAGRLDRTISLRPRETPRLSLPLAALGAAPGMPGFYRLHARWDSPEGPQERQMRFAVVHPLREMYDGKDTFLGQNHSFATGRLMTLTRDAGTSWVRSWLPRWENVEPQEGQFDFAEVDAQLAWLEGLGFRAQFCLADPSSEWSSAAPAEIKDTTGEEAESRRVWWMPKDMKLYGDYVAALMQRYGDRVKHWEVLNEPMDAKGGPECNLNVGEDYVRLVQAASEARARVGNEGQIMSAGLDFLKEVPNLSPILSSADIVSEHRYPRLQSADAFAAGLEANVAAMRAAGHVRPIWITEYGVYADDDPDPTTVNSSFMEHAGADSERLAAIATVKQQVVALANGVEKVFFHIGNWPITLNREHGCGFHPFFEWGGAPRKMFVTENVLCWALPPGARFSRAIRTASPIWAYQFATSRGTTIIAWSDGPVALPARQQERLADAGVQAFDVVGRKQPRLAELTENPVYLLATTPESAEAARRALRRLATEMQ